MGFFKDFLEGVCLDDRYSYNLEEYIAEIHTPDSTIPACLIEYNEEQDKYVINFRMGLLQCVVADITYRMTILDRDLVILEDFIIHDDDGIIYGKEAQSYFYLSIYKSISDAVQEQDLGIVGATFVVKEPLDVFIDRRSYSSKIKKLWLDEGY